MDKERYNVCFKGEVLPGFDPDKSKNDFVRMFKIPAEKANIVFSGKPIVLKKNVDKPTAIKFQKVFKKVGLKPVFKKTPLEKKLVKARPAPEKPQFACPKCGILQKKGLECRDCGVVFAKYEEIKIREEQTLREKISQEQVNSAGQEEVEAERVLAKATEFQEEGKFEQAATLVGKAIDRGNTHWKLRFFLTEQKLKQQIIKTREEVSNLGSVSPAVVETPVQTQPETTQDIGSADQYEVDPDTLTLYQSQEEQRIEKPAGPEQKQVAPVSDEEIEEEMQALEAMANKKKKKKKKNGEAEQVDNGTLKPGEKLHIYDYYDEEAMVTEDIKEVRAALLGGILLPDYSYKVDGKGEAETIDKKLKDSYFSLMMILTPFKGVVQIFVTIAAIIGFILVLPTSIPWAWEYTLGCFGWLWEVTGENAIFFVVLFLPFAKVTLVCALLVICAPAALGGLVTSLGGAVVGAVAGAVLYPFLPKVKWKKVAVALPDSQEQDQE